MMDINLYYPTDGLTSETRTLYTYMKAIYDFFVSQSAVTNIFDVTFTGEEDGAYSDIYIKFAAKSSHLQGLYFALTYTSSGYMYLRVNYIDNSTSGRSGDAMKNYSGGTNIPIYFGADGDKVYIGFGKNAYIYADKRTAIDSADTAVDFIMFVSNSYSAGNSSSLVGFCYNGSATDTGYAYGLDRYNGSGTESIILRKLYLGGFNMGSVYNLDGGGSYPGVGTKIKIKDDYYYCLQGNWVFKM